jgi:hypothetical protein
MEYEITQCVKGLKEGESHKVVAKGCRVVCVVIKDGCHQELIAKMRPLLKNPTCPTI